MDSFHLIFNIFININRVFISVVAVTL
jgi:hypothetical protein